MAASSANISVRATFNFVESFGNFGAATPIALAFAGINQNFAVGNAAAQFNNLYAASVQITSGTPLLLDLNGGTLKNPDQSVIAMTDIVAMGIVNNGTPGQILTAGGGSNDISTIWGASGTEIILPGAGSFKIAPLASGFVVTPSTAHVLQLVVASGTNVPVDIFILGH